MYVQQWCQAELATSIDSASAFVYGDGNGKADEKLKPLEHKETTDTGK